MIPKDRDFRLDLLVFGLIALGTTAASALLAPEALPWVAGCGIGFLAAWLALQARRSRRIRRLALELDRLLHNREVIRLTGYEEGELAVLADQIQKLMLSLRSLAQRSQADKMLLADALADISHQLRTPLTAIQLTVSLLSQRDLSQQRRMELTRELRELLEGTAWLVETLLKMSRLDAGMVELKQEPVRLSDLAAQAAKPLAIAMELRGQRLEISVGEAAYTGDLCWSAEALGNILKNAMEHTPEGGTITVRGEQTALFTRIEVEDTGPGFDPEDIHHLFERFYKGKGSAENSYGIGLALARQVITAQNGTITAQNTPTGAKFTIKFYYQMI